MLLSKRIKKVLEKLRTENVESFFIKNPKNIYYLSGFKSSNAFIFLYKDEAFFLTDFRYIELARKELSGIYEVVELEKRSIAETIKKIIGFEQKIKMAFEVNDITYFEYNSLQNDLGNHVELFPSNEWVEEFRKIKDEVELGYIEKAQKISEKTLLETLNFIKEGITEKKVARILENYFYDFGAEDLAFKTIVVAGKRSSLPHGVPSENQLRAGDLVTIDMGCKYMGYCSDMTRTFAVRGVDENGRKIYNTVLEAQKKALNEIKAGKVTKDIDKISRDYITDAGYGQFFGHGLGHSLGIEIHEAPVFSPLSQEILKENMVMTVEPGVYVPDNSGVRIEDLIVIKENGIVNLTEVSKELVIL